MMELLSWFDGHGFGQLGWFFWSMNNVLVHYSENEYLLVHMEDFGNQLQRIDTNMVFA